jgi:O-acetyl-ADP-ribose deacetylase (regulator of RNase III)
MLHFINTSILDADSQTVVNTVNTVGVMGKGLAKHFAELHPEMFKLYKKHCENGSLDVGKLWLWKSPDQWILNFPTKKHWRNPSKIEYIESGLIKFVEKYEEKGIREISFPRLGCGNGGLDWENVRPLMEHYLERLPITIYVHDYQADIGAPEHNSNFMPKLFLRSFNSFLKDLNQIISDNAGTFKTIENQSIFHVSMETSGELTIYDFQKNSFHIPENDLFEAWQMLLHGPLIESRMIGIAKEQSSYLLGILATMPYIRPLEIRQNNVNTKTIGVELIEKMAQISQLTVE